MLKADGGLSATARALKKQRAGNALGRRCGSVNGSAMGAELHRNLRSYALTASRSRLDAALVLLAAQNRPSQRRLLRLVDAQSSRRDAALAFAPVESANRCSLLEIAADACHWPLGDPHAADFAFCGNTAVPGLSYCVGHARMAYRLPVRRRA